MRRKSRWAGPSPIGYALPDRENRAHIGLMLPGHPREAGNGSKRQPQSRMGYGLSQPCSPGSTGTSLGPLGRSCSMRPASSLRLPERESCGGAIPHNGKGAIVGDWGASPGREKPGPWPGNPIVRARGAPFPWEGRMKPKKGPHDSLSNNSLLDQRVTT
jgi:hypothetical protein